MEIYKVIVAVLPMRFEPSHKSEMCDELLYGELVEVRSVENGWANISCVNYNYQGWVPVDALSVFDKDLDDCRILTSFIGQISVNNVNIVLPRGSRIYDEKIHDGNFEKLRKDFDISKIVYTAKSYLNCPYCWGGRSPLGIDCSGFVQMVYMLCGMKLPRDASQQVCKGVNVEFVQNAIAGDIAFFGKSDDEITHTGIILSDNKIIHSSGKVRIDTIDHEGIYNVEKNVYSHKLRTIKRLK